ncbi:MAG: caspase family protein [Anaerolineae bacterium]|nr:caspase family protein [Anaerolineae bacterium]
MRRALVVGINDYPLAPLSGCVSDATKISMLLEKHEDGSPNFSCKKILSSSESISKTTLKAAIAKLLEQPADMALFYFSGHGIHVNSLGGYLVTPDASKYDEGVSMTDILILANNAPVREVVIILDCCYSGTFGNVPILSTSDATLREGVAILTASGPTELAAETKDQGVFTNLICAALDGGASDVRGEVNVASMYSYCDQILGAWDQRPRFKANVSTLTEIRMCKPQVDLPILRLITTYFTSATYIYPLDPSYEPDKPDDYPKNEAHEKIFGHFQKYRAARLLEPIGEEHLYFAAMRSKNCRLTPLGQFYWNMVKSETL